MTVRLLVVDDEAAIVFAMSEYFTCGGWEVGCARGLLEATAQVDEREYIAAIIDLRLTGYDSTEGLEVLDELHRQHPETLCILLTAYGFGRPPRRGDGGGGADRGQAHKAGRAAAGITAAARHRHVVTGF